MQRVDFNMFAKLVADVAKKGCFCTGERFCSFVPAPVPHGKIVAKVLKARKGAPPGREMRSENTEFAPFLCVLFYVFKVFRFLLFLLLISCFY